MKKKVSIVIVNFNGYSDTIKLLNTLLSLNYDEFDVIIVDNASNNNSVKFITDWMNEHSISRVTKTSFEDNETSIYVCNQTNYILIESGLNVGFAGGNNIGIRYAQEYSHSDFYWLLNNDTVVDRNALTELTNIVTANDKIGICGSVLLEMGRDGIVQTSGGKYSIFTGVTSSLNAGIKYDELLKRKVLKSDFPVGASMLVTSDFVDEVGYMCEDYFLYFEEIDWVTRGAKKDWKHLIALNSIVWHKGSTSIGLRSALSDYFGIRSKLLFTKRFYPYLLPFIYLSMLIYFINRIRNKQYNRLLFSIKLCIHPDITIEKVIKNAKNITP